MTQLATVTIQVDVDDGMNSTQVEGYVAAGIAWYFNQQGFPGNAMATCTRLDPSAVLANVTQPVSLPVSNAPTPTYTEQQQSIQANSSAQSPTSSGSATAQVTTAS